MDNGMENKDVGNWGEDFAVEQLKKLGCRIAARNYHTRYGEIDIILEQDDSIAFVEVRTRSENHMVSPLESITPAKRQKIIASAKLYLEKNPSELVPRFDVFAIVARKNKHPDFEYITSAFDATE